MKKGFTLAEVLITLVVIGIVAAITIPIVQQKHEKAKLYSQFMKTYSTLNQAMNMAIAMGNFPSGFDFSATAGSKAKTTEFLNTYLKPYLKVLKVEPCFGMKDSNIIVKDLTGKDFADPCTIQSALSASDGLVLQDGSVVAVLGSEGHWDSTELIIDVNASKGPNTIGRDIHLLKYFGKTNKPVITGNAHYGNQDTGEITLDQGYYNTNCDPSKNSSRGTPGDTCADKLLHEGKMNY